MVTYLTTGAFDLSPMASIAGCPRQFVWSGEGIASGHVVPLLTGNDAMVEQPSATWWPMPVMIDMLIQHKGKNPG